MAYKRSGFKLLVLRIVIFMLHLMLHTFNETVSKCFHTVQLGDLNIWF